MSYQSLYRRYRPRRFSDVRGQDYVIRSLSNAVRDDRVGHAYLFSGPRGTGKTSTARILAKALNCEHLVEGEPDGTCDSCLAIDAGTSYDVQELDAASNNGVGDVRELIGRVSLGSPGRTKVYILDEVHMLSPQASAALLKTLEEPPDHVVFVLATTDPQKVLPTIRSRTQHLEFHLLSVDELSAHVAWVIHDAALGVGDDVIDHVVRAGAGSARDTLSALDQVAAAGGVVDDGQPLDDLMDAVASRQAGGALMAVAVAIATGRDPRVLGEAVLARLRDIFLLRMGGGTDHLPPGDLDRVRAWADQLGDRATTRALEAVGDALLEMRQAPDPRIPLEVALVKITRVDADVSLDALAARIAALEAAAPGPNPAGGNSSAAAPGPAPSAPVPGPAPVSPAVPGSQATPGPSGRPQPPPRPGGRPADGARAQLAARRNERASTPRPSGPDATPEPTPASTGPGTPAREAAAVVSTDQPSGAALTGAGPATSRRTVDASGETGATATTPLQDKRSASLHEPESDAPAPPAEGPPSDPPGLAGPASGSPPPADEPPGAEQLTTIWNEAVLPSLGGLAKAMYSVGRFTEVAGSTATLALPNEVHRQKCEQKRTEVEAALSRRIGRPIHLQLVTDRSGAVAGTEPPGDSDRSAAHQIEPEDDFDLGGGDVHDLDDAPNAPSGGIDALTQAFPGSELVEGT